MLEVDERCELQPATISLSLGTLVRVDWKAQSLRILYAWNNVKTSNIRSTISGAALSSGSQAQPFAAALPQLTSRAIIFWRLCLWACEQLPAPPDILSNTSFPRRPFHDGEQIKMTDTPSSTSSNGVDKASNHTKYRLRVIAGPSYDPATHFVVPVNSPKTMTIENEHILLNFTVRIRTFTGFPKSSPKTSSYFEHALHKSDQYSISFSFVPKVDIPGNDLVFGNDFDRPIRDRLPPGFNQAFKIVKWFIDPGLDGDVYADKPYLYGPALSSWNVLRICDEVVDEEKIGDKSAWKLPNADRFHDTVVEEGAEGSGEEIRSDARIPADSAGRKKFFLTEANREDFVFEAGRLYQSDFGNPYLDFNDFSLKLPGFSLNVINYIDSKTHELRYTLKNKATDEVYAVVMFTLLFGEELEAFEKANNTGGGTVEKANEAEKTTADDIDDPPPDDDDVD